MPGLGSGRGVSMDTRTAEVLYVLSRGGQLEHPHMILVPYATHQPGPTLKDVKARLVALRGRGMPGSFSWSYKRNYKESFIWCDLFDDDCILPLSATGEYVLKAMELFDVDEGMEQVTTGKPEHRHVVSDVSMAIKKSLLLINNNTPGDGVDQIMKSLTYSSRRGTSMEVDSSSTDERTESEKQSSNGRIAIAKSCTAGDEVIKDCKELSESSPTPAKRRTWEKEMDTSTICTQVVHRKSPDDRGDHSSEDPFFFGVLRKATRLGSSFRPRLCRGVDVMDSTRFKTKLQFRSKSTKHEDAVVVAASKPQQAVKEFKTLSEYFESPPLQLKLTSDDSQPTAISVKEEIIVPDPVVAPAVAPAVPSRRPFGNEALDASYRKTMEVLTKLPTSRGSCRIHTLPVQNGGVIEGAQKLIRSDSTRTFSPMKQPDCNAIVQQHEPCSIHGMESTPLKQRPTKGSAKPKGSSTGAGFEASTASCRAKAVVKSSAERTMRSSSSSRSGSKESSANSQDRMEVIPGNKHSESKTADVASSNDGGRGWPFEQPARPRDFQTREDRKLTPGLSSMDWEKSLESVIAIDQPVDLVLHECSQCGRTFKLDSLQVHMRGCRGVNKAKSSSHKKVSH